MSLIDELAGGDIDLDNLKICDLGVDISALGWQQSDEGTLCEVIKEGDKYSMNVEEEQWCLRVLDSCRVNKFKRKYILQKIYLFLEKREFMQ